MDMKYVYLFTEGNADMRNLLGGKGANLAEMTNIGLPVPQGFTITTHLQGSLPTGCSIHTSEPPRTPADTTFPARQPAYSP